MQNRRNFLKTSAIAAGFYLILSQGKALANPASGYNEGISKRIQKQFRLFCVDHPEFTVGQIAWKEAADLESINSAEGAHVIKVDADGPERGGSGNRFEISAQWTAGSLTPLVNKSVVHRLLLGNTLYAGNWINEGDPDPKCEKKYHTNSDLDLPITSPEFSFKIFDTHVTATVTKSGFFIGELAVSGGENKKKTKKYTNSDSRTSQTEQGAEGGFDMPDLSLGGGLSPKSITAEIDIENESGVKINTKGKNTVTKSYEAVQSEEEGIFYRFDGNISSSMDAIISIQWTIVVQKRNRKLVYINGNYSHVESGSETKWETFEAS